MTVDVRTLCVVGAGTMGTGIAQAAAQAGIRVVLIDTGEAAFAASRRRLAASLAGGVERGKLTPEEAAAVEELIAWDTGYGAVPEADWVIEAVFEDAAAKLEVLQTVSRIAGAGIPITTNTSTLRIAGLAQHCTHPSRFLGTHFFNPVPAMKLAEVIPSAETSPDATRAAVALCERLGKTPILAPDIPGFIVNRVFAAVVAAAVDLWECGAEAEAIDQAIELGLAHKMGPLKSADLVGLDVMLAVVRSLYDQTGDPRFRVPEELCRLVAEGKLGRKSGRGFYSYTSGR